MGTPIYNLVERKGHWLTGLLREFRDDRLAFVCENARIAPLVKLRLGHRRVYFVAHPDLIRDMLVTHHRHMVRERTVRKVFAKTMGNGLLTSDGDYWKRQRRMLAPGLHLQQVGRYADMMVQRALAMTERWQDGQELDIEKEMDGLTLAIVTAVLFRIDGARHAAMVPEAISTLQAIATREIARLVQLPDWVPTAERRKQRSLSRALRAIVMQEIAKRHAGGADGSDDLLTLMVHMTDSETGERMTDEQICDEVVTLYLAGYDTTALTLTYCWYAMARDPQIESRFHDELDRVLGERLPTLADLERLEYTRAIFKEALRLYPPAYFAVRQTARPIELGGHPIPAGAVLMTSSFAMHRSPELWDDPERFDPGRFANDAERDWPKLKYFPFGGGPRTCIGNQLALAEGTLILATVGQRYRLELLHADQRLELEPQITLGPKGGMPLRLRRRALARQAA